MRIMMVEDDDILAGGLRAGLALHGFTVEALKTCEDARAAFPVGDFDAALINLMLPDGSGLDLLGTIRKTDRALPVIMLTGRDAATERIVGLDLGADDYVCKPFDLGELAARLRAIIRRSSERTRPLLTWADLSLDPAALAVTRAGRNVRLSRREFAILHALMRRPGMVMSKSDIEERLYGWQEEIESNAIEVHVHHLRQKLGANIIETLRGVGYRLFSATA